MTAATLLVTLAIAASPPANDGTATATSAVKTKKPPSAQTLATAQAILAQQVPPGVRGGPRAGNQAGQSAGAGNAQQLIDVIQSTIAPSSWDVNGGPGSIMFFGAGGGVLVVRQGANGEAHRAVGDALNQMRH